MGYSNFVFVFSSASHLPQALASKNNALTERGLCSHEQNSHIKTGSILGCSPGLPGHACLKVAQS